MINLYIKILIILLNILVPLFKVTIRIRKFISLKVDSKKRLNSLSHESDKLTVSLKTSIATQTIHEKENICGYWTKSFDNTVSISEESLSELESILEMC